MDIAIDFDGTIVEHQYPEIGAPNPGAIEVIKGMQERGNRIILFTMRSGTYLKAAVQYCEDNGIKLYGVNRNPDQDQWTTSPKAYAQLYIDDAALGCPLRPSSHSNRMVVDWTKIAALLSLKDRLETEE